MRVVNKIIKKYIHRNRVFNYFSRIREKNYASLADIKVQWFNQKMAINTFLFESFNFDADDIGNSRSKFVEQGGKSVIPKIWGDIPMVESDTIQPEGNICIAPMKFTPYAEAHLRNFFKRANDSGIPYFWDIGSNKIVKNSMLQIVELKPMLEVAILKTTELNLNIVGSIVKDKISWQIITASDEYVIDNKEIDPYRKDSNNNRQEDQENSSNNRQEEEEKEEEATEEEKQNTCPAKGFAIDEICPLNELDNEEEETEGTTNNESWHNGDTSSSSADKKDEVKAEEYGAELCPFNIVIKDFTTYIKQNLVCAKLTINVRTFCYPDGEAAISISLEGGFSIYKGVLKVCIDASSVLDNEDMSISGSALQTSWFAQKVCPTNPKNEFNIDWFEKTTPYFEVVGSVENQGVLVLVSNTKRYYSSNPSVLGEYSPQQAGMQSNCPIPSRSFWSESKHDDPQLPDLSTFPSNDNDVNKMRGQSSSGSVSTIHQGKGEEGTSWQVTTPSAELVASLEDLNKEWVEGDEEDENDKREGELESSKDGETRRKEKSKKDNLLAKNVVGMWISFSEKEVFEDGIEKLKHQIAEEQQAIQKKLMS